MSFLRLVFWDEESARLRAGWRVVIQAVLLVAFMAGLGLLALPLADYVPRDPLDRDVSIAFSAAIGLAIFLSVWVAGHFIDRRRFVDFGFRFNRSWWIDLVFGLAVAALLQTGIFLIELASGWATVTGTLEGSWSGYGFSVSMIAFLLLLIGVGLYEETWNRGYLIKNLAEGLSFDPLGARGAIWLAAIGTAVLFALGHLTNPGATLFSTLAFVPAGLLYAGSYVLTGELAIPIGFHIGWNFFEGAVFGFPVSSYSLDASVFATRVSGPELWTGGAFGPEAGLLGVLARVAGIVLIAAWVWWRCGGLALRQELATPDLLRRDGGRRPVGQALGR
jgi:membrane protease YdiL (CAAX protease family)